MVPLEAAKSEIFLRVGTYIILRYTDGKCNSFIDFKDSAGTVIANLSHTGDGYWQFLRGTNLGTVLAISEIMPMALSTWYVVEARFKPLNSGGVFQLKVNGQMVIDYTGDTTNGLENVKTVNIGSTYNGSYIMELRIDDIGINDTNGAQQNSWLGDGAVLALMPSGAGSTTELTPSAGDNYACVDERPPSTADYVASSTVDAEDTYALADLPSIYTGVRLVQPMAYAALAAAGSGAWRGVLRSGGTNYADAADKILSTSYAIVRGDVYYTDPADSNPLTPTKVNAFEAGVRVR
ncbi:MAG: hypothetical protein ACUVX1_15725 [Chloroflexota bacterium]